MNRKTYKNNIYFSILILLSFFIIQFINKISIESKLLNHEKSIIQFVSYFIEKSKLNKKEFIEEIEKKSPLKIELKTINQNDQNNIETFTIQNSNLSYKKKINDKDVLYIETSIYESKFFLYKILFLSSSIGILFILFGIVFFINFGQSFQNLIRKQDKNLKESKISMNSILKYINTGIIIFNSKGKIKRINYYAHNLLISDKKSKAFKKLNIFKYTGKKIHLKEFYYKEPREGIIYLNNKIFYIQYRTGIFNIENQKNFVITFNDVNKLKKVEKKQKNLIHKLKKSNLELKDITYGLSHDLKAPLNGIRFLIELMKENESFEINDLNKIIERINSMNQFIQGILNLFKINYEQYKLEELDLNSMILEIFNLINTSKNIKLILKKKLPIVYGEKIKFFQLFENILSNSIKYMNKENGIIKINFKETKHKIIFSLFDNGQGIEKKNFKKIFKLFETLNQKDTYKSTGIGLSIVKKIISSWNEKIWIKSKIEKGTLFYFTYSKKFLLK